MSVLPNIHLIGVPNNGWAEKEFKETMDENYKPTGIQEVKKKKHKKNEENYSKVHHNQISQN